MTEAEWMASEDPQRMLAYVANTRAGRIPMSGSTSHWPEASERKLRLFVCACARAIRAEFSHPVAMVAVEAVELFLDAQRSGNSNALVMADLNLKSAHSALASLVNPFIWQPEDFAVRAADFREWSAADAAVQCCWKRNHDSGLLKNPYAPALLREIIGNVFAPRPATPLCRFHGGKGNPGEGWCCWRDGKPGMIARAIYEERRFADLPILADALEEAGCIDQAILAHLRKDSTVDPHVLGCWALDLILGKE